MAERCLHLIRRATAEESKEDCCGDRYECKQILAANEIIATLEGK